MNGQKPKDGRHNSSGFTLIELLVVIAIISILAAVLFPVFATARDKARQSSCASNMKQIAIAALAYSQDYDEQFPQAYGAQPAWWTGGSPANATWEVAITPYVKDLMAMCCPNDAKAGITGPWQGFADSYAMNGMVSCHNYPSMWGCYCTGISCGDGYTIYGSPQTVIPTAKITYPSATILFCEVAAQDADAYDTTNGKWTQFGHWNAIGWTTNSNWTFPQDLPSGIAPPGTFPNGPNGSVSTPHSGKTMSNFAFVDGHVKAMIPTATNPTAYQWSAYPNANDMWDATRP
jgi:prepilin-type N-terminal cleavage/methylation domain-containing protein/prepilin-type processing-associated H-X9-DG protein